MEYTSEEESRLSEVEINEYKNRYYEKLQSGEYQLMNMDGTLKCPFCPGKKKQVYGLDDLLQHAKGIGHGSVKRNVKQRAKHFAFSMFIETCLAKNLDPTEWPQESAGFAAETNDNDYVYCWPWTGIIVNVEKVASSSDGNWFEVLSKYKPVNLEFVSDDQAVVEFPSHWTGFRNAVEFERAFEFDERSKNSDLDVCGWLARLDDYHSEGPIGEYLRRKTQVKSLLDIVNEEIMNQKNIPVNLYSEIEMETGCIKESLAELKDEVTTQLLHQEQIQEEIIHKESVVVNLDSVTEMETEIIEEITTLSSLVEEREQLHQEIMEETQKRRMLNHDGVQQIPMELSQRVVVVTEPDRQELEEEIQKKDSGLFNLDFDNEMDSENIDEALPDLKDEITTLSSVLEEREQLHQEFMEETKKRQRLNHEAVLRICDANKKRRYELETKKKENDQCTSELSQRVVVTELDRQKLEEEKKQNEDISSSLQAALLEQTKSEKNVLRLTEQHKRNYEAKMRQYLQLEKQMEEQHKLEMEFVVLIGNFQVTRNFDDDDYVKEKIPEIIKQLKEKANALSSNESLDQVIVAREVLIEELEDYYSSVAQVNIGIRKMGEIEQAPFVVACYEKLEADEAEAKAIELTAFWQERMRQPDWYPFKVSENNGTYEEIIDEDDEELKKLKEEWGNEAQNAVVTAMEELKEYNLSGRYPVKELWNFEEGRKATLKEAIMQISLDMKTEKLNRKKAKTKKSS